jgi:hypothetical protein
MPLKGACKVCVHPDIVFINRQLLDPTISIRQVSQHYKFSTTTTLKHKTSCIPHALARIERSALTNAVLALKGALVAKQQRLEAIDDAFARLRRVWDERAADPELQNVPGGKTGIVVKRLKALGGGQHMQIVEEYEIDTDSIDQYRRLVEHAAKEMGDFGAKDQVNGHGVSLVFIPHAPPGASQRAPEAMRTIDAAPHHVKALEASAPPAEMPIEDVPEDIIEG